MTEQPYPGPGPMPPQGPVPVPVPGYPAVPRPDMSFPHRVPTPYHRMLRTWTYEWWKPAVGILLVLVGFFVVTSMVYIVVAGIVAAFRSGSWIDNFLASADLSNVGPETLLALNLGLGSMILVTWFVVRVLHGLRPRWLTSVVPRMRWKFFVVCLGLSVIALAAQIAVGSVLPGDAGGGVGGKVNDFTTSTALAALVVLLTTPLQAAGEEYVFRGYLLQALGSLFSNRWVAIGATGVLFALAHGVQNFPLFFDRLAFGLIAAWLVIRTGGLEAGIALHVLNNFLAFGIALSYGDLSETLNITEASWWNLVLTVTQSAVYAALVLYVARRMGLQTRTRPPSTQPGPASTGTVDGSLATA
jgi:membrane protease YdiL (CAAX protease family)